MRLAPGNLFERYRIEELVGRGGMGEVYAALDTRLHRRVALKVIRPDKDDAREGVERFLREARAAAALNHPSSVAIYELGEAEGIPYIAMELVDGVSLKEHTRATGRTVDVDLATRVRWLVDVARALSAAHKLGLIHRDIKPGNVMVSREGQVKVLDFGLAKAFGETPTAFHTDGDSKLGTPRYMAPEQIEGKDPSPASDQWALGTTAYELLSYRYTGGALAGRPAPLDTIVPDLPIDLALVVARMIERNPGARYPSMDVVATELAACLPLLEPKPDEEGPDTHRGFERPSAGMMAALAKLERTIPLAPALGTAPPPPPAAAPATRGAEDFPSTGMRIVHANVPPPNAATAEETSRQENRGFVVLAVVVVFLTVIAGAAGAWIMR